MTSRLLLLVLPGACGPTVRPAQPVSAVKLRLLTDGAAASRAAKGAGSDPHLSLAVEPLDRALARAAAGHRPATGAPAVAEARRALKAAREAYRKLDFEGALERLNRAQRVLVPLARDDPHFALVGRVSLRRGLNLLALKQPDAAAQALRWALALGQVPEQPGRFPPDVETLIARLRTERRPAGSLSFVSPTGARVFVDGKARGTVPVNVSLPPGLHHLRLSRLGRRDRALLQLVAPGKVDRVAPSLAEAPPAELASQLRAATPAGRRRLGDLAALLSRALGGGDGALVPAGADRTRLLWLRPGRGQPSQACGGEAPGRCVAGQLYLLATGKPLPSRSDPRPRARPLYKRWWFWTLVGAVATGAAVGTTAYVVGRDDGGTAVDIVAP